MRFKFTGFYAFQVILGLTLMYWGYQYLENMEDMEYRMVEQYLGNWYVAPVFARLLIGVKLALGVLLILNIKPKKLFPMFLGAVFAVHLYDLIWGLTASNIVIANNYTLFNPGGVVVTWFILLLTGGFAIYEWQRNQNVDLRFTWVKYPILAGTIVLPFILNAIFPGDLHDHTEDYDHHFKHELGNNEILSDLSANEGLVCFYSTSCTYCVKAARKIAVSQKRFPLFPEMFICFQGNEEGAQYFLEVAEIDCDYTVLSLDNYEKMSDLVFPKFQFVSNNNVLKKWDGQTFNFSVMHTLSNNLEF